MPRAGKGGRVSGRRARIFMPLAPFGTPDAPLSCMAEVAADRQKRIALLERVIASERELLAHPMYGVPAGRVIAEAKHELAILRTRRTTNRRLIPVI